MRRNLPRPLARARDAYARTEAVAADANDLFVSTAALLRNALLGGAHMVSTEAVALIPALTMAISETAFHLGKRSEAAARTSTSVVVASLPAAFYRTAATVSWLGTATTKRARHVTRLLFGPSTPASGRIEQQYRAVGRMTSELVREGLDALLVIHAVRAHLHEIRGLEGRAPVNTPRGGRTP